MAVRSLVIAVAALTLAACGGGDDNSAANDLPECAQSQVKGKSAEVPEELPSGFPLPEDLVLTFASADASGHIALNGYEPGDIEKVFGFFESELPKQGYEIADSEGEEFEREAEFEGTRSSGHLRVFASPACEGAVRVFVDLTQT